MKSRKAPLETVVTGPFLVLGGTVRCVTGPAATTGHRVVAMSLDDSGWQ